MVEDNFSKLCRCCMKSGVINMFSTFYESQPISKILEQILSKQISSKDLMPKTICQECFTIVISQFLFLRNYNRVQEQFLRILQEQNDNGSKINDLLDTQNDQLPNDPTLISHLDKPKDIGELTDQNMFHTVENSSFISDKDCIITQSLDFSHKELNYSSEDFHCDTKSVQQKEENDKSNNFSLNEDKTGTLSPKHCCIDCNEPFEFFKQLQEHCKVVGHTLPRNYVCNICSRKFITNSCLRGHMKIHTKTKSFVCGECNMAFTRHSNLKRHEKRHTGEKSYFCEVCSKGFIQKHTLTVHMRVHNGETPYICEHCSKGFRSKPLLHQHMYKHSDIKKYTLQYQKYYMKYGKIKVECKVCQKIITKSAMYNHMKIQHGDDIKKFLCNLCGKTYATKMSLDVHMNIHTKEIKYDCKICGKSFTHQNYLKIHLLLHSGERPHCCDICGKTFVQRTHLDRHKKTHTGARPYSCTYCKKSFALNENLKVHTRIHTKETPYCCSECGKGFFNSSSRRKHEINVHQIQQK